MWEMMIMIIVAICMPGQQFLHPISTDYNRLYNRTEELTEYLDERENFHNTEDGLRQVIFGDRKICFCLVAERIENGVYTKQLAGYSLYFPAYSSFTGTILHMDDLFVREKYRGNGVGKRLYQAVANKAIDMDCQVLDLRVKPSNKKAMAFYEMMGAVDQTKADEPHKMRMTRKQMETFVRKIL